MKADREILDHIDAEYQALAAEGIDKKTALQKTFGSIMKEVNLKGQNPPYNFIDLVNGLTSGKGELSRDNVTALAAKVNLAS